MIKVHRRNAAQIASKMESFKVKEKFQGQGNELKKFGELALECRPVIASPAGRSTHSTR